MTRNFEPVTSRGRYEDTRSHARIQDGADLRQSRINASTAVTIFGGLGEPTSILAAVWSAKSPNGTAKTQSNAANSVLAPDKHFSYYSAMNGLGRPTSFQFEMCEQAHNYCLLGATNDELAGFFAVSPRTIDNWIAQRPDFAKAVKSGRVVADAKVARAIYTRAVGYERKVEREVLVGGELKSAISTFHYPPNVQAGIFWLRNRRRRTWRDAADDPSANVDDIALLDAAGECLRHDSE